MSSAGSRFGGRVLAPPIVQEVLHSPGQPLDPATREFMEPRFGHDFGRMRVHADRQAAASAEAIGAHAYTVGRHVVFAKGRYSPGTQGGRLLLAHELAHAVQQQDSNCTGAIPEIGDPSARAEREADAAARAALTMTHAPWESARTGSPVSPPMEASQHPPVRRASVNTWAGELSDPEYKTTYETDPRAKEVRPGVHIHLKFTPNGLVDAKQIAFVQSVTALLNGLPVRVGNTPAIREAVGSRMTDVGTHIDWGSAPRSPFIEQQFGVNYSDATKSYFRELEMTDDPGFKLGDDDTAEMTFETWAVAVEGAQQGVYYGGVTWGWTRDPSKEPEMKTLRAAANAPSSEFLDAAGRWDKSKSSTGEAQIHLPAVTVKYVTQKTKLVDDPAQPGKKGAVELDVNSAVEVTETTDPAHKDWQNVVVIEGAHRGKRGWVMSQALSVTKAIPGKQGVHPNP